MAQLEERGAVHLHHLDLALHVELEERAVRAEACVVHEEVDLEAERRDSVEEVLRRRRVGEIERQGERAHLREAQPLGQRVEPRFVAGDENDVVPVACEAVGELLSEACRGSGDERDLCHGFSFEAGSRCIVEHPRRENRWRSSHD